MKIITRKQVVSIIVFSAIVLCLNMLLRSSPDVYIYSQRQQQQLPQETAVQKSEEAQSPYLPKLGQSSGMNNRLLMEGRNDHNKYKENSNIETNTNRLSDTVNEPNLKNIIKQGINHLIERKNTNDNPIHQKLDTILQRTIAQHFNIDKLPPNDKNLLLSEIYNSYQITKEHKDDTAQETLHLVKNSLPENFKKNRHLQTISAKDKKRLSGITTKESQRDKGIAKFINDKDLGPAIDINNFLNSITFSKWCHNFQRYNCSYTDYIDKHQVKQLLPQVAPGLNFAEEYAYVSAADEITEELVAKLPDKYFMKVNNYAMSEGMVEVEGGHVNCLKSELCQKKSNYYGRYLTTFLRMLCADFLHTASIFKGKEKETNCFAFIPPKCIFEEEFRTGNTIGVTDYKVFVFHGRPMFISIMSGRENNDIKVNYVTTNWVQIDMDFVLYLNTHGRADLPEKPPPFFHRLVHYAAQIGRMLTHARVDFFVYGDEFSFAELQQSNSGCFFDFAPHIANQFYGYLLVNPDVVLSSDYILRLTNQTL